MRARRRAQLRSRGDDRLRDIRVCRIPHIARAHSGYMMARNLGNGVLAGWTNCGISPNCPTGKSAETCPALS
jgi:hypothetical protein